MRYAKTAFLVLCILIMSANRPCAEMNEQDQERPASKEDVATDTDMNIDTVIEMLSLIVLYKQMEEDKKALQDELEERYDYHRHEDPFAFKSRMLNKFLKQNKMSKEKFNKSVHDFEHAIYELKSHYHRSP